MGSARVSSRLSGPVINSRNNLRPPASSSSRARSSAKTSGSTRCASSSRTTIGPQKSHARCRHSIMSHRRMELATFSGTSDSSVLPAFFRDRCSECSSAAADRTAPPRRNTVWLSACSKRRRNSTVTVFPQPDGAVRTATPRSDFSACRIAGMISRCVSDSKKSLSVRTG